MRHDHLLRRVVQRKHLSRAGRDPIHAFRPEITILQRRTEKHGPRGNSRKDLVEVVHKFGEEGKVAIRHGRTHARESLKKLNGVSEDAVKQAEKDLQKVHDDFIHKIDELIKAKEAEIMEV